MEEKGKVITVMGPIEPTAIGVTAATRTERLAFATPDHAG
jgi:hypothetical protein